MSKVVVLVAAIVIAAGPAVLAQAPDPALIGWWQFDEGSGAVAVDSSGKGNDASLYGGVYRIPGYSGTALDFDGIDGYVGTGMSLLDNVSQFTISFWVVSWKTQPSRTGLVGQNDQLEMGFMGANIEIWSAVSGTTTIKWPYSDKDWHHAAVVGDTSMKIYVDGKLLITGAGTTNYGTSTYPVNIGGGGVWDSSGNWFTGRMDDVRIYNRALSAAEVKAFVPVQVKAYNPNPADGALDKDPSVPLLQWTRGETAAFHDVYLGASPDLTEADRVKTHQPQSVTFYYHAPGLTPGARYYWRVDEVEKDGVTIHTGDVWTFLAQAPTAYYPIPADGANTVLPHPTLTWLSGTGATGHTVYFGLDANAVAEGAPGTEQGTFAVVDAAFQPGDLDSLTTYFWRVDETVTGGGIQTGPVWSFTTALVIDDFENYTDEEGGEIYQTWIDGLTTQDNGSTVGYLSAPYTEQTIVHDANQSMPFDYNNVESPFYSEAYRDFETAQDWTAGGTDALVLYVQGRLINTAAPLFVAVEDSSKKSASVVHPDPKVVMAENWIEWRIPFSEFAGQGVKMDRVRKMYVCVGDKAASEAGGKGRVFIDSILLTRP
jgi:hypothetical protein